MKRILILFLLAVNLKPVFCGEGMWIPLLVDSLNYSDMKAKGLRLTPEQIYNSQGTSLKDAVVLFGNGCTAEVISNEGLIITNHHCGYSRIVSHSTPENNYLSNGFWASSKSGELPNRGLTVTFLKKIEDVTAQILSGISDSLPESERISRINANIYTVRNKYIVNTQYQAEIKPFYFGSQYYIFIYEIFKDVRLVGAPSDQIGKFGGDTDNWVWPRHTGDFSLFRIYADKNNLPAEYAPDNVPYKPEQYLAISASGYREGDFTMVLGYPAKTDHYLMSDALQMIAGKSLPAKVDMRTVKLNTLSEIMNQGTEYKLKYAAKYAGLSNAWKKWIGVTEGVKRADVIEKKMQEENSFKEWAQSLEKDPEDYAMLMDKFHRFYNLYNPLYLMNDLGGEVLNSFEITPLVDKVQLKFFTMRDSSSAIKKTVYQDLKKMGSGFFKTKALEIDRKTMPAILKIYADFLEKEFQPAFYDKIRNDYQGDYQAYVNDIFRKSMFTDSIRYRQIIRKSEKKVSDAIINDPLMDIYRDFSRLLLSGMDKMTDSLNIESAKLYRKYIAGLAQMNPGKTLYPDANFTMRLSYGKIEGYQPLDAEVFSYYTTLDGIMEKEDPEISDYKVPVLLKDLYRKRDFAPYGVNNSLPVCFSASNHTSGGNSGSPVLNADGNLIGINFDRNWEGTVSDFYYDPLVCRNISLDIRYVLFIIDKYANADWLLNELTIINE